MTPALEGQPALAVALTIASVVTVLGPLALAAWWIKRTRAPVSAALYGALVFFVSQVILRLPWQIALGVWLAPRIKGHWGLSFSWGAASALTAGLFEEIGRWAGFRWLVRRERSLRVGVLYGMGHGGIEAILLVGLNLSVTTVLYILMTWGHAPSMPAEASSALRHAFAAMKPVDLAASVLERAMAMAFHVAASLVVLQCFARRSIRWLWIAVLFHFATDLVSVEGAAELKRWGSLAAEAAGLPSLLVSIAIIARAMRRWATEPPATA